MNEIRKIVETHQKTDFATQKAALATVIKVEGSSYRSPGARMYLTDNGRWIGSISGGCLEGDALRKSRKVISEGRPQVITYDTMDDDSNSLGVGLGCNGIIHILLEPIEKESNSIKCLEALSKIEDRVGVATVFSSSGGSKTNLAERLIVDEHGAVQFSSLNASLIERVTGDLKSTMTNRKSRIKEYELEGNEKVEVFLEVCEPAIDLIIFGGGFDAKPVANFAKGLGWDVRVVDECIAHLFPANFPDAKIISCDRSSVTTEVDIKPYSAAVLMSHNLNYDFEVLKQLVKTDIRYIGILGPTKRANKLYTKLEQSGYETTDGDLRRIHSPIGIDIGADNPEEIAISIIAEIKAKFASRSGGFLKYRQGPIHDKDPKSGEVFKQVYVNSDKNLQQQSG